MKKYLFFLLALVVLVGCAGGPEAEPKLNQNQDEQSNADDQLILGSDDINEEAPPEEYYDETPSPTVSQVKIKTTTVNYEVSQYKSFSKTLKAEGGSGNYIWSGNDWLPSGLSLQDQSEKSIKIKGVPTVAGEFRGLVRVCDAEDAENCAEKEFKIKVNEVVFVAILPTLQVKIIERLHIETDLKPKEGGEFNSVPVDQLFNGEFRAVGGTPPYTWKIENFFLESSSSTVEGWWDKPCDHPYESSVCPEWLSQCSSDTCSDTTNENEPLNISASFAPDLYCEKSDGTLTGADWDTICKNEYEDRSKRVYRSILKVTVTDSSDRSVSEEYEFNFTTPSISNQKADQIFAIEANLSAHDCGGRWGCQTHIYLYGKDNITIERQIGRGQPIDIESSGWGSTTQKRDFVFNSAIDPSTISLDTISKVHMTIDDGSMGDYGEMWLSSLIIYSSYYYMVLNLEGNQLGGEVGLDYDTSASRMLSEVSGATWKAY